MFYIFPVVYACLLLLGKAETTLLRSQPDPRALSTSIDLSRVGLAGCGTKYDFAGKTKEFSITSSGGKRKYLVHVPGQYDPNKPMPLLIAYHGSGSDPLALERATEFSSPDVNPGMISVYPAGINKSWEGPSYASADVSDLQFTTDLVKQLKNDFCIDTKRIYATGHSNGGGFVNTLACSTQHGGQFAGFAPVAASLYTDLNGNNGCDSSERMRPIFEVHGDGDMVIPYEGGPGRGGPLPDIMEWIERWSRRNQCTSGPSKKQLANNVTDLSWTCGGQKGVVRHVVLEGGPHAYPSRDSKLVFLSPYIIEWLSGLGH